MDVSIYYLVNLKLLFKINSESFPEVNYFSKTRLHKQTLHILGLQKMCIRKMVPFNTNKFWERISIFSY